MDLNLKEQKYTSINCHNPNTDWFCNAKYGLFFHVLPTSENFETVTRQFDVAKLAKQCHACGCEYVMFTIGQNSGYLNVPSERYDFYTKKRLCAERDIAMELYEALAAYHISLILYAPCDAPKEDLQAAQGLGVIERNPNHTKDWFLTETFEDRWSEVLAELSVRYGEKVRGWWMDGAYAWSGFRNETARKYSTAVKSGNPKSIVAFNGGVNSFFYPSQYDDYTAGEYGVLDSCTCEGRWFHGIQWHELSFISEFWGRGPVRYTPEQIANHINGVNRKDGVVTLDLPMEENFNGIRQDAFETMQRVGDLLEKR